MTLQLSNKVEAMGCNNLSSDILSERICIICIPDTVGTERKYTLASKPSTQKPGGLKKKWGMRYMHHPSQDHLTSRSQHDLGSRSVTWPGVKVSDPWSPGEIDEVNVHFFWRRVYSWAILIESSTYALYNMHNMENDAWKGLKSSGKV